MQIHALNDVISLERPVMNRSKEAARGRPWNRGKRTSGMLRRLIWALVKAALILVVLAALGLLAYAYVGPMLFPADFAAPATEVVKPITLEIGQ